MEELNTLPSKENLITEEMINKEFKKFFATTSEMEGYFGCNLENLDIENGPYIPETDAYAEGMLGGQYYELAVNSKTKKIVREMLEKRLNKENLSINEDEVKNKITAFLEALPDKHKDGSMLFNEYNKESVKMEFVPLGLMANTILNINGEELRISAGGWNLFFRLRKYGEGEIRIIDVSVWKKQNERVREFCVHVDKENTPNEHQHVGWRKSDSHN